jgi:hypothetical protein
MEVTQLVIKFPTFYGIWKLVTKFTSLPPGHINLIHELKPVIKITSGPYIYV